MPTVSFDTLQYDLFLVVSFIIVYFWQFCLFVGNMRYIGQCHLSLCRYAVFGSAICCFAVKLAASSVLVCSMRCLAVSFGAVQYELCLAVSHGLQCRITVQCELFLAVATITVQCGLCLAVSFVAALCEL